MTTEVASIRLDSKAKKRAFKIFRKLGIKPSAAINLFFHQVVINNGLPFKVVVPPQEQIKQQCAKNAQSNLKTNLDKA